MAINPESLKNLRRGNKRGPSKIKLAAKDAMAAAADKLGGVDRIVAWVKEDPANERVFWSSMWARLIPLQHSNDPENPIAPPVIQILPVAPVVTDDDPPA